MRKYMLLFVQVSPNVKMNPTFRIKHMASFHRFLFFKQLTVNQWLLSLLAVGHHLPLSQTMPVSNLTLPVQCQHANTSVIMGGHAYYAGHYMTAHIAVSYSN